MRFTVSFTFEDDTKKDVSIRADDLVGAGQWAKAQLKTWNRKATFDIEQHKKPVAKSA